MLRKSTRTAGFTLVEMIVAVALFSVVMLVSVSTLLSLVNANRKAQALQSVMNNLNIALDSMVRSARMGSHYDGSTNYGSAGCSGGNNGGPKDCTGGGNVLSFRPFGNTSEDPPWIYTYTQDSNGIGHIYKSVNGQEPIAITAPEVAIDDMKFYVAGTDTIGQNGNLKQPKIVIVIEGSVGALGSRGRTTFHIQATAVQRVLDL